MAMTMTSNTAPPNENNEVLEMQKPKNALAQAWEKPNTRVALIATGALLSGLMIWGLIALLNPSTQTSKVEESKLADLKVSATKLDSNQAEFVREREMEAGRTTQKKTGSSTHSFSQNGVNLLQYEELARSGTDEERLKIKINKSPVNYSELHIGQMVYIREKSTGALFTETGKLLALDEKERILASEELREQEITLENYPLPELATPPANAGTPAGATTSPPTKSIFEVDQNAINSLKNGNATTTSTTTSPTISSNEATDNYNSRMSANNGNSPSNNATYYSNGGAGTQGGDGNAGGHHHGGHNGGNTQAGYDEHNHNHQNQAYSGYTPYNPYGSGLYETAKQQQLANDKQPSPTPNSQTVSNPQQDKARENLREALKGIGGTNSRFSSQSYDVNAYSNYQQTNYSPPAPAPDTHIGRTHALSTQTSGFNLAPLTLKNGVIRRGTVWRVITTKEVDTRLGDVSVKARLLDGVFAGATVLGEVQEIVGANSNAQSRNIRIKWHTILPANTRYRAIDVNAQALSLGKHFGSTAVATSVKNHYLRNYTGAILESMVQGYGNAYSQNNGQTTIERADGTVVISNDGTVSSDEIKGAMASALASRLNDDIARIGNIPRSFVVAMGTPLEFELLSDIDINSMKQ